MVLANDMQAYIQELRARLAEADRGGTASALADGSRLDAAADDPGDADAMLAGELPLAPSIAPHVLAGQTLRYTNGDVYQGEVLDGRTRQGQGRHTCAGGEEYEGGWRLDQRHGRGRFRAADGTTYEGQWEEDKAHGQGACSYPDGSRYEGEWRRDQRCGWGRLAMPDGQSYEGEWAGDAMHGRGRWEHGDGSAYEGWFEGGERTEGTFTTADGSVEYCGRFEGGLRQGQGRVTVSGLYTYKGEWRQDLRHGQGECRYGDGSVYVGAWRDDARDGHGTLTGPGGYTYTGGWRGDKQHGTGVCRWGADGECSYSGEWQGGQRHGQGRGTLPGVGRYIGGWQADKPHGQGACWYLNGNQYQGAWQEGKRHGQGLCVFSDGACFAGLWEGDAWVQPAADPRLCRLAGKGLRRAVAGQLAAFEIQARDASNQPRLSGGDVFLVEVEDQEDLGGSCRAAGSVADRGDGTYAASYTATAAGAMALVVTDGDGEHLSGSPFALHVAAAAPAPRRCCVEGASACSGAGWRAPLCGSPAEVWVQARDTFGNACASQGLAQQLQLQATLTQGSRAVEAACAVAAGGRVCCAFTPPSPGPWVLELTGRDAASGRRRHLPGSPFSVQVLPPLELAEAPADEEGAAEPAGADAAGTAPAVQDLSCRWEQAAWDAYVADDGDATGFASDDDAAAAAQPTPEQAYVQAHPDVPLVERLTDLWKVSRLQAERKARQQQQQQQQREARQSQLGGCGAVAGGADEEAGPAGGAEGSPLPREPSPGAPAASLEPVGRELGLHELD